MNRLFLEPGAVALAQSRSIYGVAPLPLSRSCDDRIAARAAAVTRILAKGVPDGRVVGTYLHGLFADDELVEITPKSIRLRKRYLKEHERKRANKADAV